MLWFLFQRAWQSLRSTPTTTLLAVLAVTFGTALPTAVHTIRSVQARDPIPEKSDRLFNVRLDSWDPDSQFFDIEPGDPPKHVTYRDMSGLLASEIPKHRTGIATTRTFAFPSNGLEPFEASIRMCHADFFPMVEAPFAYGSGWARADDEKRRRVIVLSHRSNERMFDGADSVGELVRLGGHQFEVVGVLAPFRPIPQYYDVINNAMGEVRDFFLPFDLVREETLGLSISGDMDNWGPRPDTTDPDAFYTASEATWIQYWVELEPGTGADYSAFVDAYTEQQKALNRFPKPQNNRVTPLMAWLSVRNIVPKGTNALLAIAIAFMAVCGLNLSSLLLGKYLSEGHKTGVIRALGATRGQVFFQRIVECQIVGIAGGVVGAAVAQVLIWALLSGLPASRVDVSLYRIDAPAFVVALLFSVLAGLLAGVYPAWRASKVAPAIQLRIQ